MATKKQVIDAYFTGICDALECLISQGGICPSNLDNLDVDGLIEFAEREDRVQVLEFLECR